MACLEMYKSDHPQHHHKADNIGGGAPPSAAPPPPMSPRISFSNDFVESSSTYSSCPSQQQQLNNVKSRGGEFDPPSSDFEFSVSNYSMMSADDLFSKGRLLPLRENSCSNNNNNYNSSSNYRSNFNSLSQITKPTTLRDELLVDDDNGAEFSLKPPKGRWKGFLGLRKSHIGCKSRLEKTDGSSSFFSMDARFVDVGKRAPQEMSSDVESNDDMETEI